MTQDKYQEPTDETLIPVDTVYSTSSPVTETVVDESTTVEQPNTTNVDPSGIWDRSNPKAKVKKFFPKPKKQWGLIEVTLSMVIFIVLTIIMLIAILGYVTAQYIPTGENSLENVQRIQDDALALASTPILILVSSFLMYFSWLGMMWYSTKFKGLKSFAKDFGLKFKWKKDILIGLGLAVVLFGFVQGSTALLGALGFDLSQAGNTEIFKGNGIVWTFVLMIGLVGIIGPICEELFFRGFLLQGLIKHFRRGNVHEARSPFGEAVITYTPFVFEAYLVIRNFCYKWKYVLSIIISSACFGLMHFSSNSPGGWLIVAITGTLGLVFAIIAVKTRRLGITIFGHIFYNTIVAVMAITLS